MQEVGFWALPNERNSANDLNADSSTERQRRIDNQPSDQYLDPLRMVDDSWFERLTLIEPQTLKRLQWFLTIGAYVESYELAYSFCRFDCSLARQEPKVMGAVTLTDGTFVWPEGFWHYVHEHHVKPPQAFLDHFASTFEQFWRQRQQESAQEQDRKTEAESTARTELESPVPRLLLWDPVTCRGTSLPVEVQQWIQTHTTLGGRDTTTSTTKERNEMAAGREDESGGLCGLWPHDSYCRIS